MGELTDKAKGRAKEIAGVATNDRNLEAEGKWDQAKGAVKGKIDDAKVRIKDSLDPNRKL